MDREITPRAVDLIRRRFSSRLVELNREINDVLNDDTPEMGEALLERIAVRAAMERFDSISAELDR